MTSQQQDLLIPRVLDITTRFQAYETPKLRYIGIDEVSEFKEAVEIIVRTDSPFLVKAVMPVIFVGESMVNDFEAVDSTLYRFFAFDYKKLREGSPIYIGWPDQPENKIDTDFKYSLDVADLRN